MMARYSARLASGVVALGAIVGLGAGTVVRAGEVETRDFTTRIDGNPAGQCKMTITRHDDGRFTMACTAEIKVTKLGITVYKYSYKGTEVWSGSRLASFESSTDDDGTRYNVVGTAERGGLRLKVNGHERMVRPDVWTTSYWRLPETKRRNGSVPLLDADEGKTLTGVIRPLGVEKLTVAGQSCDCAHYRITGPNLVDAWFDGQDRLVRQEWTEKGHKVRMELTAVRR